MKKLILLLLSGLLILGSAIALADDKGAVYTLSTAGAAVLQGTDDRAVAINRSDLTVNPVIPGESTTTGLPLADGTRYLPMLVTIGSSTPWGAQYADIIYESILYRNGATCVSFLYSDSFAEQQPVSAGSVRYATIGNALLREEWGGGLIYAPEGSGKVGEAKLAELGADEKGVVFNVLNENISDYWGNKKQGIDHFAYDADQQLYLCKTASGSFSTYPDADNISKKKLSPLSFSNVIIQRVYYEYIQDSKLSPAMQSIGQGNADIFIGGRFIPGYWVRESIEAPTVFFDDQGSELQLTRGKTFIAHFPVEALLTYGEK